MSIVEEENARLEAEYDASKALLDNAEPGTPEYEVARRRFDAAQLAWRESRKYWRSIGEAVAVEDPSHPGARGTMVKVQHEDGSVQ